MAANGSRHILVICKVGPFLSYWASGTTAKEVVKWEWISKSKARPFFFFWPLTLHVLRTAINTLVLSLGTLYWSRARKKSSVSRRNRNSLMERTRPVTAHVAWALGNLDSGAAAAQCTRVLSPGANSPVFAGPAAAAPLSTAPSRRRPLGQRPAYAFGHREGSPALPQPFPHPENGRLAF